MIAEILALAAKLPAGLPDPDAAAEQDRIMAAIAAAARKSGLVPPAKCGNPLVRDDPRSGSGYPADDHRRLTTTPTMPALRKHPAHRNHKEQTMSTMKAILIGRHAPDMGAGIEILDQRAVTWPATAAECGPVIEALMAEARSSGVRVLLQNTPGQVAIALAHWLAQRATDDDAATIGVIVSRPGARPARVRKVFPVPAGALESFTAAVKLANPRATVGFASYDEPDVDGNVGYSPGVEVVSVEVDGPPMPFEFSHIEWL